MGLIDEIRAGTYVADEPIGGLRVTLSCGVAASAAGSTFVYDDVFAAADAALYEAKGDGRDCVRAARHGIFTPAKQPRHIGARRPS